MQGNAPGRRICVVGCSGSGKTTLADDLFLQQVNQPLQGEHWLMTGNYSLVRAQVRKHCETLIWLNLPRATVTRQVIFSRAEMRAASNAQPPICLGAHATAEQFLRSLPAPAPARRS